MQHFMHPKNVGEIKNADGIGEVGNMKCGDIMKVFIKVKDGKINKIKFKTFGCLPKDEEVVVNSYQWNKISKISKGFGIINGEGNMTKVLDTHKRKYKGILLKIIPFVSPFNSFLITPKHPVMAIKRNSVRKTRISSSCCNLLRVNHKKLLSTPFNYIEAENLDKGDYIVFRINNIVKDFKIFDKDTLRLIGYYLAEGYITANGNCVNFALNKKENEAIEEIKYLIYKILNKTGNYRIRGNVIELYVCSKKLADFLYKVAGKYAKHKNLSKDIMFLPFKKQWELIETYWIGDGNKYKRRDNDSETFRALTVSKNLALQLQFILARGGIFASIKIRFTRGCSIDGRLLKDSVGYEVSFKLEKKHKFVHDKDNFFLVPIRTIEEKSFNDFVYNLTVLNEPNSYLVKGFVVHNCGAAIASSDALCELAKGKTIEKAKKITNKDIIKYLGGEVPSLKVHCSVLGQEALKKSIQDYESKLK